MPYQSRGFWHCSYCDRLFDDFHEANFHESLQECQQMSVQQSQHHQQQQQNSPQRLPTHPDGIVQGHASAHGGISVDDPEAATAAALPPPPSVPHPPYHTMVPSGRGQHSGGPLLRRAAPSLQPGLRVLFGDNDVSRLTEHDAVAVRNLEVFAVDHPEAVDGYGNRLALGLIGIRCIHCIGPEAGPRSVIFPRSSQEVGDCIREVAEWHLGKCHRAPQTVHRILQAALQRRHKAKIEGGPMWYQEEQDRGNLLEYCAARCRELRLLDNFPPRTGMMSAYYGDRQVGHHLNEAALSFEESKQPARAPPDLDEPFDSGDLAFDDDFTNPEPFMVPDQPAGSGYETVPTNFPFFREPSGDWICKFCQHIHPQYRDPQNRWAASHRSLPPAHFIDFHLNLCRMYQQSLLQDYRGPPNPVALPNPIGPSDARHVMPAAVAANSTAIVGVSSTRSIGRRSRPEVLPLSQGTTGQQSPQASAIAYLEANDLSGVDEEGRPLPPSAQLAVDEDRLLLTDYFFYLFKQLRLCRFTETDRKTRGGKRQTIQIGYGGLQCVHCAGQQNPRKFFWANVDRIANSFAEMPNHILRCRYCPGPTRDALLTLKESHAEQMTRLPRGSQKVFLRRMWRRLHENDPREEASQQPAPLPDATAIASAASPQRRRKAPQPLDTESDQTATPHPIKIAKKEEAATFSPGTSGSDGTVVVVERSTEEAAKALAYSSMQTGPPSPASRVLLSTPEDRQWLSDHDCFVRKQIEVFCATRDDVEMAMTERKQTVREGRVGLRCIHCALSKRGSQDGVGVYYPVSINALYDSVREFQRLHLETCPSLPQDLRNRLEQAKGASSLSSVLRNYFQMSAKSIGLVDTNDGIRATGQNVPLQSQEFTFAERKSPPREGKSRKSTAEDIPEKSEKGE